MWHCLSSDLWQLPEPSLCLSCCMCSRLLLSSWIGRDKWWPVCAFSCLPWWVVMHNNTSLQVYCVSKHTLFTAWSSPIAMICLLLITCVNQNVESQTWAMGVVPTIISRPGSLDRYTINSGESPIHKWKKLLKALQCTKCRYHYMYLVILSNVDLENGTIKINHAWSNHDLHNAMIVVTTPWWGVVAWNWESLY